MKTKRLGTFEERHHTMTPTPNRTHRDVVREQISFAYHAVAASVILCVAAFFIGVQIGLLGTVLRWFDFN